MNTTHLPTDPQPQPSESGLPKWFDNQAEQQALDAILRAGRPDAVGMIETAGPLLARAEHRELCEVIKSVAHGSPETWIGDVEIAVKAAGLNNFARDLLRRKYTPTTFSTIVELLGLLYARRVAYQGSIRLMELSDEGESVEVIDKALSDLGTASLGAGCQNSLSALLGRQFNPDSLPVEPEAIYRIGGAVIATPGNLSTVSAAAKTGKSAVIGAMLSATMTPPDGEADNFGIVAATANTGPVLHFDTEQADFDHDLLLRSAMRRAEADTLSANIHSFWLKGKTPTECRTAIRMLCQYFARDTGKLHSVFIDGVADLVDDVNQQDECNALVSELEAMAVRYKCPFITVIHQNPGSQKTRGHLGSQLERKAESNLQLEKDGETTVIFSTKQRRAPISKDTGPRFQWSVEHGMHRSVGSIGEAKDTEKVGIWKDEITDIFADHPSLRYSDLLKAIPVKLSVSTRTAERRFAAWKKAKLVEKSFLNLWAPTFDL
jgi:hypothetical protein